MRKSNRTHILEAAVRVVQRDGVTAVTYESVATEAGLTKGGLLYHFPSREALLRSLHEYLAERWEARMVEAAGTTAEHATVEERLAAYTRVSAQASSRAELLLMLEATDTPAMHALWAEVAARWTPDLPTGTLTAEQTRQLVTRLAADGLWLYSFLADHELAPRLRGQVAEHLVAAIEADAGGRDPAGR